MKEVSYNPENGFNWDITFLCFNQQQQIIAGITFVTAETVKENLVQNCAFSVLQ